MIWSHFVMFDECANTAQSRLEGRKPIRRLLCEVQKDLNTARSPLHVLCGFSECLKSGCNRTNSLEFQTPGEGLAMDFLVTGRCDLDGGKRL